MMLALITVLALMLTLFGLSTSTDTKLEWFYFLYFAALIISSFLAGAVITVVLMLYNAVRNIINAIGPKKEKQIIPIDEDLKVKLKTL
ncbi:hypothetical protein [Rhodohalobacter barkolensis]|nr:hypothetical protein [Rhodohalobacter barkolensis]